MELIQKKYEKEINELIQASIHIAQKGYVTSHGGNLSYRIDAQTVLITPTKVPKIDLTFDDIVIINYDGEIMLSANGHKPTGETPIHLNLLKKRPDIKALVHAHPPILTGFSLLDEEYLARPVLPEPIIELGPVTYIPYAEPLSDELAAAFDQTLNLSNAFLMRNHGVMVCSPVGVGRAVELLEMLECMAHSVFVAASLGSLNNIAMNEVDKLERTIRTRDLPMPGAPGTIKNLSDAYACPY